MDNDDYQTVRDIFATLGMGKLVVDAEPSGAGEEESNEDSQII